VVSKRLMELPQTQVHFLLFNRIEQVDQRIQRNCKKKLEANADVQN
jgi:hypothetical protein